jgi:Fe-S oxidoreductase
MGFAKSLCVRHLSFFLNINGTLAQRLFANGLQRSRNHFTLSSFRRDSQKKEDRCLFTRGKNCADSGSARGIGRAIAERLAAEGVAVVINYARTKATRG